MNQAINDPSYRLQCQLDELGLAREPSFGSYRLIDTTMTEKPPELEEPEWNKQQWDYVRQIKAEMIYWRKQHAETLLTIGKLEKLLIKKNDDFIYG